MKVPAAATALCVFVITATACAPTADQAPAADETAAPQADVESLKTTINAHWEAINAGDRQTTADQHLPRFTLFSMDEGPLWVLESEEDYAAIEEAFADAQSDWRPRDLTVDLYGDVAVAAFYAEGSTTWPDGRVVEGPRRVTAVWIWDGGEWKEAHHHDSPLVSAPAE
jgi:ketosteroid isomerase-like protein